MKHILIVAVLALSLWFIEGYQYVRAEPKLEIKEIEFNFGNVRESQDLKRTFKFQNNGDTPLIIEKIRDCCGCAAKLLTDKTILPGEVGQLQLVSKSTLTPGHDSKIIYVHTNEPARKIVRLMISWNTQIPLAPIPKHLYFGEVEKGKRAIKKFELHHLAKGVAIKSIKTTSSYLQVKVIKVPGRTPFQNPVPVEVILGSVAPVGQFQAKVLILTNDKERPVIEVPVEGLIKGNINLFPKEVFFGIVRKGESPVEKIVISCPSGNYLRIIKVQSSLPFVDTKISAVSRRKQIVISARLKPDAPIGEVSGYVVLSTNDHYQPKLHVPVYGLIQQ